MATPNPEQFDDPELVVLAALVAHATKDSRLSALDLSHVLEDEYGIAMHWRTVEAALERRSQLVSRVKRGGRWSYYALKGATEALDGSAESDIKLVEPAKAVASTVSLHSQLEKFKGVVCICDPYVDQMTLRFLEACKGATEIRILTTRVTDSGELRTLQGAYNAEGRPVVIRRTNGLHDRWILDRARMLILGTSLNGFGNKQCFVITAGEDFRQTMSMRFGELWQNAKQWP